MGVPHYDVLPPGLKSSRHHRYSNSAAAAATSASPPLTPVQVTAPTSPSFDYRALGSPTSPTAAATSPRSKALGSERTPLLQQRRGKGRAGGGDAVRAGLAAAEAIGAVSID